MKFVVVYLSDVVIYFFDLFNGVVDKENCFFLFFKFIYFVYIFLIKCLVFYGECFINN